MKAQGIQVLVGVLILSVGAGWALDSIAMGLVALGGLVLIDVWASALIDAVKWKTTRGGSR